jgi:mannan endo-1,4-beta-mannosidase
MKALLISFAVIVCFSVTAAKPKPTDHRATKETVHLYQNLIKLQKKGLMFGHQDDLPYGYGWMYEEGRSDVRDVCGDYPAVYGWELGHIELGDPVSLDSVRFDKIKGLIIEAYKRGGVNTISWHHRNALTGGKAWDVSSNEVVKSILPGGSKHELYLHYLDKLASFLLSLKTEDGTFIPVIFRPYHEHTGSWFWWGKNLCTVEEYKALWRFTVTYLCDMKDIHHLLYAYSPDRFSTREEYLERYPGDDIIDLLAFDLYDRGADYPKVLGKCAEIVTQIGNEKNKIVAVSEAGGHIARQTDWWTKTLLETLRPFNLSYVLVWRNPWNKTEEPFAPYKGSPSSSDFVKFYNDPKTLFQKDITPLKLYN